MRGGGSVVVAGSALLSISDSRSGGGIFAVGADVACILSAADSSGCGRTGAAMREPDEAAVDVAAAGRPAGEYGSLADHAALHLQYGGEGSEWRVASVCGVGR